jgi:hypothetical protein
VVIGIVVSSLVDGQNLNFAIFSAHREASALNRSYCPELEDAGKNCRGPFLGKKGGNGWSMGSIFKKLRDVYMSEFISEWDKSETNSDPDQFARDRLVDHRKADFNYSEIEINEQALTNIILPSHNHIPIQNGTGQSLADFAKTNTWRIADQSMTGDCLSRIRRPLSYFEGQGSGKGLLRGIFMFVADEPSLALLDHYGISGQDILYAGSFHQFAAYATWVHLNGFVPLRLYHASRAGLP